ncbi:collagen alpha-2(I) chain-like [Pongo pygmaeus]|uniref:collagen alpha-2(I) chain-like n=1 Tax=Pongo pygmaeus TaxID=9600 RepID=UPI00300C747D
MGFRGPAAALWTPSAPGAPGAGSVTGQRPPSAGVSPRWTRGFTSSPAPRARFPPDGFRSPPQHRHRTSGPGFVGPTGLILPCGSNPDRDPVPGEAPTSPSIVLGPRYQEKKTGNCIRVRIYWA